MKNIYYIFLVFLFLTSNVISKERFFWEKQNLKFETQVKFLKVNSERDFWVSDLYGNIFHVLNREKSKINSPADENSTLIHTAFISPNEIYFTFTSKDWISYLMRYNGKKWTKIFETKAPIQSIIGIEHNKIFTWGNFGEMLQFDGDKVKKIDTPFKSHILYVYKDGEENYIVFTKSDGMWVFNYPKKKFHLLNKSNLKYFASDVEFNKNYFLTQDNKILKLQDSVFVITTIDSLKTVNINYDKLGKKNISFYDNQLNFHSAEFPLDFFTIDYHILSTGNLLILSNDGEVYLGKHTNRITFSESSEVYNIAGSSMSMTEYLLASDFNEDEFVDLCKLFFFKGNNFEILYKQNEAPFLNVAHNLKEKIDFNSTIGIRYFDYNNDNFEDIVVLTYDSDYYIFNFIKNSKTEFVFDRKYSFPRKNKVTMFTYFIPADFDKDGDTDILFLEYYGEKNETGNLLILENNLFGSYWRTNNSLTDISRSWNKQVHFADLTGNGENDILISTKWRKNILLINLQDNFINETEKRIPNVINDEARATSLFDYDNDGDLDILISTDQKILRLLENDGFGFFNDMTEEKGLNKINFISKIQENSTLDFGDLNNDGFTDFIFSIIGIQNKSYIILNKNAEYFELANEEFNLEINEFRNKLITDFDNDGDLDIFVGNNGKDKLWLNQTDNNNFIKVKLEGIKSNPDGFGAKVYVLNESGKIVSFKQIGSNNFSRFKQTDEIHFGVKEGVYSIKVDFYGGDSRIVNNIKNGTVVKIAEIEGILALLYKLPALIFLTVSNSTFIYYSTSLTIGFIILVITIYLGRKKFKWGNKIVSMIFILNNSIFWGILIFTLDYNNFILKYFSIPIVSLVSSGFTVLFTYILNKSNVPKVDQKQIEDDLLQLLITFSHGEWALRNLNSLQLFFQNFSGVDDLSDKIMEQIFNRTNTFVELTKFNLERIIELSQQASFDNQKIKELDGKYNSVLSFVSQVNQDKFLHHVSKISMIETANSINQIKEILANFRQQLYAKSSSNPEKVIVHLLKQFSGNDEFNSIKFNFENTLKTEKLVLIKEFELADVLVNLINNSISAMHNSINKNVNISLSQLVPKVIIDISDSGKGITKDKWKNIFERTFSSKPKGGEGLYISKKLIEKYGGRIFVKSSNTEIGTTFRIELIEGKKS